MFKVEFLEVRERIMEWVGHMHNKFRSGRITSLDDSMHIWFNLWTCPGWIFVLQNPHPFGNKYHTIDCVLTGILLVWRWLRRRMSLQSSIGIK